MNIAMIFQHKLLHGLQRFLSATSAGAPVQPLPLMREHALPGQALTGCAASLRQSHQAALANRHLAAKVMPLRVLHVVDSNLPRSSTGRLVISGRMADVCAELDRLVEREATLH